MRRSHINSCVVILLFMLLMALLLVHGFVTRVIPWWQSLMEPRALKYMEDPSVISIGGVSNAIQTRGSARA